MLNPKTKQHPTTPYCAVGVEIGQIAPGEKFEVSVALTTPSHPGKYLGYWRLQFTTDEGEKKFFGHRIWVDVVVDDRVGFMDEDWSFVDVMAEVKATNNLAASSLIGSFHPCAESKVIVRHEDCVDRKGNETEGGSASDEFFELTSLNSISNSAARLSNEPDWVTSMDNSNSGGEAYISDIGSEDAATVPVAAPVSADYSKWAEEQRILVEMGFADLDRNRAVLESVFETGGLSEVVSSLLIL